MALIRKRKRKPKHTLTEEQEEEVRNTIRIRSRAVLRDSAGNAVCFRSTIAEPPEEKPDRRADL